MLEFMIVHKCQDEQLLFKKYQNDNSDNNSSW